MWNLFHMCFPQAIEHVLFLMVFSLRFIQSEDRSWRLIAFSDSTGAWEYTKSCMLSVCYYCKRVNKLFIITYTLSAQRRLWSDWADAQADLSLRWAHSHFVGFVMRQLEFSVRLILTTCYALVSMAYIQTPVILSNFFLQQIHCSFIDKVQFRRATLPCDSSYIGN